MSAVLLGMFAALGAAVAWAVAPILYRHALFNVKPISANIVRITSNAVVLLVVLFVLGKAGALMSLPAEVLMIAAVNGILGLGVGDTLYLYTIKKFGVAWAVPLGCTYPLFSLVLATLLLGQPVTAGAALGAVVIVFGIWILSRGKKDVDTHSKFPLRAIAVSLVPAIVWGVSVLLMDVALMVPGMESLDANYALVTMRILVMGAVIAGLAPLIDRERGFLKVKKRIVIELCIGGLVANAVGWVLMNYSLLNVAASQAVPISSTAPLFAMLAGFILLHEKITWKSGLGAVTIVAGIVLIFVA